MDNKDNVYLESRLANARREKVETLIKELFDTYTVKRACVGKWMYMDFAVEVPEIVQPDAKKFAELTRYVDLFDFSATLDGHIQASFSVIMGEKLGEE